MRDNKSDPWQVSLTKETGMSRCKTGIASPTQTCSYIRLIPRPLAGILLALMCALASFSARAQPAAASQYKPEIVNKIADLVKAKEKKQIPTKTFQDSIGKLIQAGDSDLNGNDISTDLVDALLNNGTPKITKNGFDDLRRAYLQLKSVKKAHESAAARNKKIADASDAASTASASVKTAANTVHDSEAAAATNPTDDVKASTASANETTLSNAIQSVSEASAKVANLGSNSAPSFWNVSLWSGAKLENPYSITNGTLKPNNTATVGFVDLEMYHRFVLSTDPTDTSYVMWGPQPHLSDSGTWASAWPFQWFPDIDFHFGYVFTSSSSTPSNLTAATISGGSDIYSDNTIGWPFWRWTRSDAGFTNQATLDMGGGFTTDKQFLAVHPNAFGGVGFQSHLSSWTWLTRFGVGVVDTPKLQSSTTVATDSEGLPIFDLKVAPAWSTTVMYNLNSAWQFQLGANVYFLPQQAAWNISVGLSVDPSVVFKSLLGSSGSSGSSN
jgi:hypothetical protein